MKNYKIILIIILILNQINTKYLPQSTSNELNDFNDDIGEDGRNCNYSQNNDGDYQNVDDDDIQNNPSLPNIGNSNFSPQIRQQQYKQNIIQPYSSPLSIHSTLPSADSISNWQQYQLSSDYQSNQKKPFYYITQKLNEELLKIFNSHVLRFTNINFNQFNGIYQFKIQLIHKYGYGQIGLLSCSAEYNSQNNSVRIYNIQNKKDNSNSDNQQIPSFDDPILQQNSSQLNKIPLLTSLPQPSTPGGWQDYDISKNYKQDKQCPLYLIQKELQTQINNIKNGQFVSYDKVTQYKQNGDTYQIFFTYKLPTNDEITKGYVNAFYNQNQDYLKLSDLNLDLYPKYNQQSVVKTQPNTSQIIWKEQQMPQDFQQKATQLFLQIQMQIQLYLNQLNKSNFIQFEKTYYLNQNGQQYYKFYFTYQLIDGRIDMGCVTVQYYPQSNQIKLLDFQTMQSQKLNWNNQNNDASIINTTPSSQPMSSQEIDEINKDLQEQLQSTQKSKLVKIISILQPSTNAQNYQVIFEYEQPNGQLKTGNCKAYQNQKQMIIKDLNTLNDPDMLKISPSPIIQQNQDGEWEDYNIDPNYNTNSQSALFLITQLLKKNLVNINNSKFIKYDKILSKREGNIIKFLIYFTFQQQNGEELQSNFNAEYNPQYNSVSINNLRIQSNYSYIPLSIQPSVNPAFTQGWQEYKIPSDYMVNNNSILNIIFKELQNYITNQVQGKLIKFNDVQQLIVNSNNYKITFTFQTKEGSIAQGVCFVTYNPVQKNAYIAKQSTQFNYGEQVSLEQIESEAIKVIYEEIEKQGYDIITIKKIDSSYESSKNIAIVTLQLQIQDKEKRLALADATVEITPTTNNYKIINLTVNQQTQNTQENLINSNSSQISTQPQSNNNNQNSNVFTSIYRL